MILLGLLDAFNQPELNGEFPLIHVMYMRVRTQKKKIMLGQGVIS